MRYQSGCRSSNSTPLLRRNSSAHMGGGLRGKMPPNLPVEADRGRGHLVPRVYVLLKVKLVHSPVNAKVTEPASFVVGVSVAFTFLVFPFFLVTAWPVAATGSP